MKSKSKFNIFAISLYVLLLILLSFITKYVGNLNLGIADIFTNDLNKINTIKLVLDYIEIVIFYVGLGIVVTINCIDYLDSFSSIVLFSILFSLGLVIISCVIKSFIINIDFIKVGVSTVSILLGVLIEILIKIKQIRGDKE